MSKLRSFLHDRRKNKLRSLVLVGLAAIATILGCFLAYKQPETVSVFSIPEDVTPVELERRGFEVMRAYRTTKNGRKEVSKIERCSFPLGLGATYIHYRDNDTTRISSQIFRLDNLTFQTMTKLKPANYSAVLIDGISYYVKQDSNRKSVFLSRLNLKNREPNHHYYCRFSD
ncbi:MAG TPA: hypothetical protein VK151_16570 [Fluviicola sp.]|nr:hypothetical protein [Fluviicola sp.]